LVARTRALIADADIAAAVRPLDATYVLDELDRTGVERALALSTAYVNATDVAALGARKPSPDEYRLFARTTTSLQRRPRRRRRV
jgi:hypothetical protein